MMIAECLSYKLLSIRRKHGDDSNKNPKMVKLRNLRIRKEESCKIEKFKQTLNKIEISRENAIQLNSTPNKHINTNIFSFHHTRMTLERPLTTPRCGKYFVFLAKFSANVKEN